MDTESGDKFKLEVCIDSIGSARAAIEGGAHRLECCSALSIGGLTPSVGLVSMIKQKWPRIPCMIMIRPRDGDFTYTSDELELMYKEIKLFKGKKVADGFVFGALTPEGHIDIGSCRTLIDAANPFPCTFHRAFDMTVDPMKALDDIINLGFSTLLTSGQKTTAIEGASLIKKLIKKAEDRIVVMPGSGINPENITKVIESCQAKEYHASASHVVETSMTSNVLDLISDRSAAFTEWTNWKATRADYVKSLIETVNCHQRK